MIFPLYIIFILSFEKPIAIYSNMFWLNFKPSIKNIIQFILIFAAIGMESLHLSYSLLLLSEIQEQRNCFFKFFSFDFRIFRRKYFMKLKSGGMML